MIPAIGIMIGTYIITRMLQLLIDRRKDTSSVTMIFAVLTIVSALYGLYVLIIQGTEVISSLNF